MKRLVLLVMLALSLPALGQRENTFYVKNFADANTRTVGAMMTKAQASCLPDARVPCILILDPTLAEYPVGTMPIKCAQCSWLDFRTLPVPSVQRTWAGSSFWGDSVACGAGAGASDSCNSGGFTYLIAPDFGGSSFNYAATGDMVADTSRKVIINANPQYSRNPTFGVEVGINDSGRYATNAAQRAMFQQFDLALLAWLSIPQQNKVFAQDAGVVRTGTWANDNTLRTGLESYSTTNGSALTFPLTTFGGPIYLAYHLIDGNGGRASVAIDGVSVGTLNGYGAAALATINGTTDSVAAVRYPVAPGAHTITLTVVSATAAGNKFEFSWAGTPPAPGLTFAPPRVLRAGVHRCQNDCNASLTADFDSMVQQDVSIISGDGLGAFFVPLRAFINATTDMFDTYHPTAGGHRKIADAFEWVAQPAFAGYTVGGVFLAPVGIAAGTPANPGAYNNFNSGNRVANATTWGAGVNLFNAFNNVYGIDFGWDTVTGVNATRIYAPNAGEICLGTHTTGVLPSTQADFTCRLFVNGTGVFHPAIKATTGTRYLCIDTAGKVVSQAAACSGT
jgi:hypothetical protein